MKRLLAGIAQNRVFANIVMLLVLLGGLIASKSMIRESIPEMSLDTITISVPYPGADPEEVEEAISRKIEEALDGMEGIKEYSTTSSEGSASATVEIKESYDPDEVLEDVKTQIESINTLLNIVRPDNQDYQGLEVSASIARRLKLRIFVIMNKVVMPRA